MRGQGRIFLRGNIYWASYYLRGKEYRESTGKGTEKEAEKFLQARLREVGADLIGSRTFTTPKACRLSVQELAEALKADLILRGKDSAQNLSVLKRVENDFGHFRAVALTAEQVDRYIENRIAGGDAPATVNRTTQLLGQCFQLAIRRGHLSRAPYIRKLSEAGNERKVALTEKQLADFLAALPDDLRDFAAWSAACAMRKGEASLLTWNMIHGEELHIPAEICKNRDGRVLPIFGELAAIIERRRKARRMDCRYIFHRDGKQVRQFDKSRRTAAKKANLPAGFVFHSLRNTAATNLIKAGVSPQVALKVGGWKTDSMLRRYCLFTTDDLRDAITKTETYRQAEAAKPANVVAMR
jgi:integrase